MNTKEFIKENPNVNITVKFGELMSFGQGIADRAIKGYIEKKDEKTYTAKEFEQILNICPATRWRWEKMGLIKGVRIGNRILYTESEKNRILNEKGSEK